ncbi:DUF6443 domain-containing protein [Chryseobacterium taeanense]|uniref:DUF6443 domain-containing protein n=1 Tax=Chryseobacterium taeanense TaxID=311334 RepID=UPI0035B3FCA0
MKKILSILGILLAISISAQTTLSTTENYIYTKTCLTGDCTKASETVQYFDSFGKPFQTVSIKSSPTGKDMVQHIPYDHFGRNVDSWNPVPMTSLGGAIQDSSAVKTAAVSVYGDSRPFSHTVLEKSPLGRTLSSISSGQEWQNHPVTMGYYANKANEVKKYTITTGWTEGRTDDVLSLSGFYPANTLVKTSVTDGDGSKSIEYKNKAGQVVLIKKAAGKPEETDTYYVYNEYSQLAFVIPPLAVNAPMNQSTYDNLCYQYRYDGWNRLVEKKVPGKGWEFIIYDQQDRRIMSQDANLRTTDNTFGAKGWMVTKYDKLGRTVYTGFFPSTDSRAALQTNVNNLTVNTENNEARSTSSFTTNGIDVYYTQNAFPAGAITVLSVNYYDTYPAYSFNPAFPTSVFGQEIMTDASSAPVSTKALPTLSLVKNIEDNNWTKSYVWYDTQGRSVATYSINHLGGYTKTESEISFPGWVKQSKVYHKRLTTDTEKQITHTYEYDDQGRLKKQYHQVGTNPQELLAENTYNELSQLINKKTGNNLQSIDYTYDVRGGLKKINDPANLNGKLFAYEMKSTAPVTASAKYNGNITEIDWRTSSDNVLKRYAYQYDGLSRMQKAVYSEPNASVPQNDFYNEELTYDLGGNIQTLKRNTKGFSGMKEQIDNLVYTYDGNKLQTVVDQSANYGGYPDTSGNIISYDDNGNMTSQIDKGILEIKYNFLNLADNIKFDNTYRPRMVGFETDYHVKTKYVYNAMGIKLKKIYTYGVGRNNLETSTINDYLDGFQYEEIYTGSLTNPVLKFVPTTEGYYDFEENQYIYSYTDHLGNVRLNYFRNTTNGSAEVLEENNYYAFGLKHDADFISSGNPSSYNYQYNGKEYQKETGWYDYGARMYMSDIGRWGVIDPLAEQMRRYSPYNYAFNNPVNLIDPDGKAPYNPRDFYGHNSAFSNDFDPNTTIYGEGSFGGYKYFEMGLNYDGGGSGTFGKTQAYRDLMVSFEKGGSFSLTSQNGYMKWWTGTATQTSYRIGDDLYGEGDLGVMHSMRLMDDDTVDNLNFVNDRIGDVGSILAKTQNQGGSIGFWTTPVRSRSFDGIAYSRFNFRYYRNNWRGNGYTGSTRSVAKYLGKGALVAQIALGAIEVGNGIADDYNDYQTKGVTYGRNTAIASAKVATGAAVGWGVGMGAGMAYGAVMGSAFPIVGTIIGAAAGAVIGYYASEYAGEIVKQAYE